jgi:hypothetical protein
VRSKLIPTNGRSKRRADLLLKVRGFLWGFLFEPQTYKSGLRYVARNRVMQGRIYIAGVFTTINCGGWVPLKREARGEADSLFRPRS